MLACAVKGELDPTSTGFDRYVADAVRGLLEESGRNILVLFTARSMLQDVYALLKEPAGLPEGTTALAQNLSGPRHVLIERFKASRGTALLGTDSFWEGIDAPGEACEIVMIPRLPFPVPTHPLARALAQRAEKLHGESFFSYAVPEAVIKFRQGTGRLIRSSSDRGALVVLDSRMVTKNYGRAFAKSIGDNLTVCSSVDDMRKSVATFLTESHDEGELTYEPVEDS
jgi:Rad3-related DNA helicase